MSKTEKGGAPSNALSVMRRQEHHRIALTLNGSARTGLCAPRKLLPDFLRHRLGAIGTHVGCEHGVCNARTVHMDDVASRSCLILAVQVDGRTVDTVESLTMHEGLSDLQKALRHHHALQYGFCTAGILMSCVDYLKYVLEPTETQVREMLSDYLCHYTGYTPIVAAALDAAASRTGACPISVPVSEGTSNA